MKGEEMNTIQEFFTAHPIFIVIFLAVAALTFIALFVMVIYAFIHGQEIEIFKVLRIGKRPKLDISKLQNVLRSQEVVLHQRIFLWYS